MGTLNNQIKCKTKDLPTSSLKNEKNPSNNILFSYAPRAKVSGSVKYEPIEFYSKHHGQTFHSSLIPYFCA